jgi:hypothetical protein
MPTANFNDPLGGNMESHQRQIEMIQRVADALTQQQNQQSNSGRASASSVDSASSGNSSILIKLRIKKKLFSQTNASLIPGCN